MREAMNDFSVRVALLSDEDGVSTLLQASYPLLMKEAYDASVLAPALVLMTKANPVLLASGTYYVAVAQGETIVGCGGWTLERPGDGVIEPGLGHIRHFGTHRDWVNQGVGRALYLRCEKDARAKGITRFQCYSSLNAERFYSALGFRSIRRMDFKLVNDIFLPGILMSCEI